MTRRIALVALVAAALAALPSTASAAVTVTDCPADAGAYAGSDPVVSELRELRSDERAACLANASRLDRAHDDATAAAAAAHDDAGAAHTDASAIATKVDGVSSAVAAIPAPTASTPYAGPSAGQVDDAARALHGDVWLLLGAGAALVFGLPLVRMVTPWWRS
jgi:hypothetical protein